MADEILRPPHATVQYVLGVHSQRQQLNSGGAFGDAASCAREARAWFLARGRAAWSSPRRSQRPAGTVLARARAQTCISAGLSTNNGLRSHQARNYQLKTAPQPCELHHSSMRWILFHILLLLLAEALVLLILGLKSRLPASSLAPAACVPRPAMFNKEKLTSASHARTETQPVASAVCTCWRCAVPRPVLQQLETWSALTSGRRHDGRCTVHGPRRHPPAAHPRAPVLLSATSCKAPRSTVRYSHSRQN